METFTHLGVSILRQNAGIRKHKKQNTNFQQNGHQANGPQGGLTTSAVNRFLFTIDPWLECPPYDNQNSNKFIYYNVLVTKL